MSYASGFMDHLIPCLWFMASLPTQASLDLAGVYPLDLLPKLKANDALNQ